MGLIVGIALGGTGTPLSHVVGSPACDSPTGSPPDCRENAPSDTGGNAPPTGDGSLGGLAPSAPGDASAQPEEPAATQPSTVTTTKAGSGGQGHTGGTGSGDEDGVSRPRARPALKASPTRRVFERPNLAAGHVVRRCITVSYRGRPARVRLYAPRRGTGLDRHLSLVVVQGRASSTQGGSCAGFERSRRDHLGEGRGVLYRGRLADFPRTALSAQQLPGKGKRRRWTDGESRTYRFSLKIVSSQAAQGLSVDFDFVWKAAT